MTPPPVLGSVRCQLHQRLGPQGPADPRLRVQIGEQGQVVDRPVRQARQRPREGLAVLQAPQEEACGRDLQLARHAHPDKTLQGFGGRAAEAASGRREEFLGSAEDLDHLRRRQEDQLPCRVHQVSQKREAGRADRNPLGRVHLDAEPLEQRQDLDTPCRGRCLRRGA